MDFINEAVLSRMAAEAVETFGERAQLDQAVEEFAEFAVALNHFKRKRKFSGKELLEEMCDCIIMAKQFEYIAEKEYGQSYDDAMSYKLSKLDKAIKAFKAKSEQESELESEQKQETDE